MKTGDVASIYADPLKGECYLGEAVLLKRTNAPRSCDEHRFKDHPCQHTEHWTTEKYGAVSVLCDEHCRPVYSKTKR